MSRYSAVDAFRYQDARLLCEQVPLSAIAQRYGTPTYVYSRQVLLGNYQRIQQALSRLSALICYSVKANSHLRILKLLGEAGAGFDVVSGGELMRALRAGGDPCRIVFSGVGKTAEEIDAGLAAGILMFNIESVGELELVECRAHALGKRAGVSMRVNPDVAANTHPYVATGETFHKFGVHKGEALELCRRAAASSHLVLRGVACHIGSQILEVDPFLRALEEIKGLADRLNSEGIEVRYLDLGGGFGIRYGDEEPLDFELLGRALEARLPERRYGLIAEPGRAVVGDAGVLLTRVLYVKLSPRKRFVVVDAGMNDLMRPSLYGSYHEVAPVERRAAGTLLADVVGPLCETGDFLAQDRALPELQPGDLLAVMTVGAYGYVLASNYNTRPRPAEVLVRGREFELIRQRERVEDLMADEVV